MLKFPNRASASSIQTFIRLFFVPRTIVHTPFWITQFSTCNYVINSPCRKGVCSFDICSIHQNLASARLYSSEKLPPHQQIALPALSPTMETGNIVAWKKKEGDRVEEGDIICEIETDKATMSFEASEEGYLAKILLQEGEKDILIGKPLCVMVQKAEDVAAFANYISVETSMVTASVKSAPTPAPPLSSAPPSQPSPSRNSTPWGDIASRPIPVTATAKTSGGRVIASPHARKLAADKAIDLATVVGTGPGGRIIGKDVENVVGQQVPITATSSAATSAAATTVTSTSSALFVDLPLSSMRSTIAKRLLQSKTSIPHYYLTCEVRVDELMRIRSSLNELLGKNKDEIERVKLSVNDFVLKASALACKKIPETNSFFMDTFIRQNNSVDISVAVSTDRGLITPIIFNADNKGLATISAEVKNLARRARQGKLLPNEFQRGTFTVSNLGMFGSIKDFSAIINPPQSCILAVGGAESKVVPDGSEGYRTVTCMNVTLSCDHRVVDGAVGAKWLKHFKDFLENPKSMLL